MSAKNEKTDLLWLRPLEALSSEFDDCVRRGSDRLDLRTGDPDDDDAREWLVIEGLLRAWRAPRDS